MNAKEAMIAILDINEMIEQLKDDNKETTPNLKNCRLISMLTDYRTLLCAEMQATTLKVFEHDNK